MEVSIALIGSMGCGKTALANAIDNRIINKEYDPTIGFDYIKHYVDHPFIQNIKIWDLSGNDKFEHITKIYIKVCTIILFCYNNKKSFDSLLVLYNTYSNLNHTKIIVYTQIDQNKDMLKDGFEFSTIHHLNFLPVSSITREGISDLIHLCLSFSIPVNQIQTPVTNCTIQ